MKHLSFLIIVTILFVGCGQGVSVTGKVTFSDGQPLTVGEVVFQTDTRMASGRIQPNGSYKLSSTTENDGVPPGKYGVKIVGSYDTSHIPADTLPPMPSANAPQPIPLIDPKFEKTETSGLTCEVKGHTTFDITVTKP